MRSFTFRKHRLNPRRFERKGCTLHTDSGIGRYFDVPLEARTLTFTRVDHPAAAGNEITVLSMPGGREGHIYMRRDECDVPPAFHDSREIWFYAALHVALANLFGKGESVWRIEYE